MQEIRDDCETCKQYGECICEIDIDYGYDHMCDHIAIVSLSETECQCVDCLRIWPKGEKFISDWPQYDRG